MSATATQEKPRSKAGKKELPEVSPSRTKLIQGWDAETLAAFIAETPADDPELPIGLRALEALQGSIAGNAGDDEPAEVSRLRGLADDKDAQADNLVGEDEEGAHILRVEANDLREQATDKLKEFRQEAGEAVGPMPLPPENNLPPGPEIDPEKIVVAGIEMAYPDMGGKEPTRATLTLVDPKALLRDGTAFPKGARIKFSGEAIVNAVSQKDEHDAASGIVAAAEQQHKARIVDLKVESL